MNSVRPNVRTALQTSAQSAANVQFPPLLTIILGSVDDSFRPIADLGGPCGEGLFRAIFVEKLDVLSETDKPVEYPTVN